MSKKNKFTVRLVADPLKPVNDGEAVLPLIKFIFFS